MEVEQIISLLHICGYILFLPAGGFLVGVVVSVMRMRRCPLDEPMLETAPNGQADPASQTNAETGDKPRKQTRRRKKETEAATPKVPDRQPVVIMEIPASTEQAMEAMWSKFSEIPATWQNLIVQEEAK